MKSLITVLLLILYFLPYIVAIKKDHKNIQAIFITNLVFGWTFLGWFVALIWAVSK